MTNETKSRERLEDPELPRDVARALDNAARGMNPRCSRFGAQDRARLTEARAIGNFFRKADTRGGLDAAQPGLAGKLRRAEAVILDAAIHSGGQLDAQARDVLARLKSGATALEEGQVQQAARDLKSAHRRKVANAKSSEAAVEEELI